MIFGTHASVAASAGGAAVVAESVGVVDDHMTDWAARLADDADPLRQLLRAARSWRVAPTVFLGRNRPGTDWLPEDTELALALEEYEAGLCPGCQQPLEETSHPDHQDAYRPEQPIRCHYCTARALVDETAEKQERSAGLLFPITLNADVVELNRLPVPPLPPELAMFQQETSNGQ